MSIQTMLIDAIKTIWHNDEASDTQHQRVPVYLYEYEKKQNEDISHAILKANGFSYSKSSAEWRLQQSDGFSVWLAKFSDGWRFRYKDNSLTIHSIAELEIALELSGIDSIIKI